MYMHVADLLCCATETNTVLWSNYIPIKIYVFKKFLKRNQKGTSLMAQWLRICLPMQGTRVRSLVREDTTCHRATKPVRHNYWACALEPTSHSYWDHTPQLLKPVQPRAHVPQLQSPVLQLLKPAHLEPMLHKKRSHCTEKPVQHNEE